MSPPEWFRNRRMLSLGTPAARPSLVFTPSIIIQDAFTFRWERTRPADARLSGSETLLRMLSLAGCTIDTPESSFQKRHPRPLFHNWFQNPPPAPSTSNSVSSD